MSGALNTKPRTLFQTRTSPGDSHLRSPRSDTCFHRRITITLHAGREVYSPGEPARSFGWVAAARIPRRAGAAHAVLAPRPSSNGRIRRVRPFVPHEAPRHYDGTPPQRFKGWRGRHPRAGRIAGRTSGLIYRPKESPAPRERGGAETSEICSRVIGVISGPWAVLSQIKPQAPRIALQCKKRVDPIESQRLNLSGSWHSGRSQHEQYLGYAGSSVQNLPHCRHSKKYDH